MTATAQGELQDMRTIHALAMAVDDKDRYTRNHSERVALYATAVAVHIGLPVEHIERIAIAGTLHDVGKLAVPDSLLIKPGPLTERRVRGGPAPQRGRGANGARPRPRRRRHLDPASPRALGRQGLPGRNGR